MEDLRSFQNVRKCINDLCEVLHCKPTEIETRIQELEDQNTKLREERDRLLEECRLRGLL